MTEKILITSALLYANGPLHFGHIAGAYLPGDCYARFQRLRGNDVLFISGSDEYGIAITLSAQKAGKSPKDHVDHFHALNKLYFERFNFSFDHYSRTSWEGHSQEVHHYFNDLLASGYIEAKITDQLYSEEDKAFLADRYVIGECPNCHYEKARGDECTQCGFAYEATDLKNPRSAVTGAPLQLKPTKHWFILLDRFKDQLLNWLESKDWRPNVSNFVKKYIKGLRPRAITRDMEWGIPLPLEGTEGKVLYVWFDAPIGYISATKEWALEQKTPDRWKDYWCDPKTKLVNFIGKDNIPFHAVIFPAMTMGQKQPFKLVDELPANEFLKLEGRQFSKSEGWYIDIEDFFERYTSDQIRYTLAANAPENSDAEFTWKDFQSRCNSDLVGKLGNLVNRTLVFAKKRCQSMIPPQHAPDTQFLNDLQALTDKVATHYESFSLRKACQGIMEIAQLGNSYFDKQEPWKSSEEQMQSCIHHCLLCLRALAVCSAPIIPTGAENIWKLLGYQAPLKEWARSLEEPLPVGQELPSPTILFQKIEDQSIQSELDKLHAIPTLE